jgi:hypothetical protein
VQKNETVEKTEEPEKELGVRTNSDEKIKKSPEVSDVTIDFPSDSVSSTFRNRVFFHKQFSIMSVVFVLIM